MTRSTASSTAQSAARRADLDPSTPTTTAGGVVISDILPSEFDPVAVNVIAGRQGFRQALVPCFVPLVMRWAARTAAWRVRSVANQQDRAVRIAQDRVTVRGDQLRDLFGVGASDDC